MSAEDTSWVFDSLVAFLNGPIWNAPLQSFVEEKSLMTFVDETVDKAPEKPANFKPIEASKPC
ncbi:hypothetical protein D910_09082 [Dendroctonus ponderosae]|uniref:BART domain-containing protein n=1 Tax=Dendroctonus ponderosae TaxID=77166 RepID=U4UNN3_DENPD|nr:hypothetical protein D910_09082 [Dendroctonus ponderosae]